MYNKIIEDINIMTGNSEHHQRGIHKKTQRRQITKDDSFSLSGRSAQKHESKRNNQRRRRKA